MTSTRDLMIKTGARMFQRDGYHATSWRNLVREAGSPWGSIDHHFPGGKQQLAVEAIRLGASAVEALIEHCFNEHADPRDAVSAWFAASAELMVADDYTSGCPVATVALEMSATPGSVRDETTSAFARWQSTLARRLKAFGQDQHEELATAILALLEGALILARANRDESPLRTANRYAQQLISSP